MSGITTGIGLVSGLPTADLIAQLMQLERRPIYLLETRVAGIQTQRTAWADLTARVLAAKSLASRFGELSFFRHFDTTSSDENVLTAVAGENAVPGTYAFTVHSLVTNHQLIGNGLANADATPGGVGTLSLEIGHGKVHPTTTLDELNGGEGVRRGTIRITDRSGATADVDLATAITLEDLLERINSETTVNVQARISGDQIVIQDFTAPADVVGDLVVADVGGGFLAADLGLAQSAAGDAITGADVIYLTDSTALDRLNDGNGVRHLLAGEDFRITQANSNSFEVSLDADLARNPQTHLAQLNNGNGVRLGTIRLTDRSGQTAQVDLSSAVTVQDVLDAINAAGIGISATVSREYILISDTTGTPEESAVNLKIEDVDGYAARDLGIAADADENTFVGSKIFRISTIGDVIRAINYAPGNGGPGSQVIASISDDGNGIVLVDESSGGQPLTIEALELNGVVSSAAADLGILGEFASGTTERRDLIAGPNTVLLTSLNGGGGITTRGEVRFTARDGTTTDINFSTAQTLQDVISAINATSATSHIAASVNTCGNGILITDTSDGTGNLGVADLDDGTLAEELGIAGTHATTLVNGGNLQLKYISENTLLEDLNYGAGIRTGRFQITDSAGLISLINVTENQRTLQDIINLINSGTADVTARINDHGDGLLITDNAGGSEPLSIVDLEGSLTAADLNIAGESADGETTIDGSYEITIEVDADDTLNDLVSKINSAASQVRASVLNDGSTNGYRLTLTSEVSGRRGELVFDTGETGLSMDTLVRAQDAVVFFGGVGGENPVVITSSTNTLTDVVGNVTVDLVGTSEDPVTLSVTQDVDNAIAELNTFVTNYNGILDRIDDYTSFNSETYTRGVLLGDSTVLRIQTRLHNAVTREYQNVSPAFSHLSSVGLTIGSGARLSFDEDKFREAYEEDPDSVEQLFTTAETGLGDYLEEMLDELSRTEDGLIARADNLLADKEELLQDRIDALELLLEKKQARLEAQFAALEQSLSLLQGQQNALAGISLPGSGTV